jgi:hypothetical protein
MPSIPVDVLHHILEHVDKASLTKICLLNKVCCSCSQDILYRDIQIAGNRIKICQTLSESTHLAKLVRSFEINAHDFGVHCLNEQGLRKSLENMTCLRRLRLDDPNFSILDGCTFKLDSFSSDGVFTKEFHRFLCNQPSLTDLQIVNSRGSDVAWGPCLPNLTRVAAHFFQLQHFISNRPVNEVIAIGSMSRTKSADFSFFTLSTAPIQKLSIHYTFLYPAPLQPLASIFPSLTHLTLKPAPWAWGMVSERFLFIYQ